MKHICGIDIGGTNIKIGVFSLQPFYLIVKKEITTMKSRGKALFSYVAEELRKLCLENSVDFDSIVGVGISVPCPVKNGFVVKCANLDISNISIVEEMKKYLNKETKVVAANDANMAAYGENMSLESPFSNVVFYTMGTGIGGGIIVNGKLLEGSKGMAGEIGHMLIDDTVGVVCGCGKTGCLEQFTGTYSMLNHTKELLKNEESSLKKVKKITIKDIFDHAKENDSVALQVVDKVCKYMGMSASKVAVVLDPDVFIIGGGISKAGSFLIERIKKYYKMYARFNTTDIPFILAKSGNDAGIIGSAYLIKDIV